MAPSNNTLFALCSVLEKDKLNGTNYTDWIRNLRIVLRANKKEDVLDTPLPEEPADDAPVAIKNAYKKACDANLEAFVESKLAEGIAVGPHVIKMVGYVQRLEKLGFPLGQELATDFILSSLPPSYGNFISNYHMHRAEKGLNELCSMLKTAEGDIKKSAGSSHVMAIQNKPSFKKKGNSWKKKGKAVNSKPNPAPKSMMSQSDLPLSFWGYTLETAAFTLNRVPSKSVVKTPYEMWTDKLTPKSDKCFFVGYPKETLGYYFYNRSEGKVFVARNGVFLEKEFLKREKSGQKVYLEEVQDEPVRKASTSDANVAEQVHIPVAIETPPQPRRSARIHELRGDLLLLDDDEPATYAEAMMDSDSEKWQSEEELVVNGYTDASFQTDTDDSQSQSGFVFTINGGAAKEPRNHQKNKHVLRKFHLIREFVRRDEIKMCKIHIDLNVADPLTKALPQPKHEAHMRAMGIRYLLDRL
ncbi:unnamed protein product [Miscanthus lutarioriparius]|uniref:Retroviral polymerase SH3-like domain-containing protein n=1 Tax=Miscanthus lutarioriparius TaxID=422564 RepID=A0A811RCR6_9POAL|nr:unnamed protein product [Miscanthus lutarioriparius]